MQPMHRRGIDAFGLVLQSAALATARKNERKRDSPAKTKANVTKTEPNS